MRDDDEFWDRVHEYKTTQFVDDLLDRVDDQR
jgi:hypothetical protein